MSKSFSSVIASTFFLGFIEKAYKGSIDSTYMDEDGYIFFTGRKKRMIIISGYNVYPNDIENEILKLDYISEACAVQGYIDAKPVIRLFEVNGWERESWNFYFDFPFDDKQLHILQLLADRVSKMEKVQQCNGKSYFEIMFVPKEFDSINWGISK